MIDRIHHLFRIKYLSKVGIEGALSQPNKRHLQNLTANIMLNSQRLIFFPYGRNQRKISIVTPLFSNTGGPSQELPQLNNRKQPRILKMGKYSQKATQWNRKQQWLIGAGCWGRGGSSEWHEEVLADNGAFLCLYCVDNYMIICICQN